MHEVQEEMNFSIDQNFFCRICEIQMTFFRFLLLTAFAMTAAQQIDATQSGSEFSAGSASTMGTMADSYQNVLVGANLGLDGGHSNVLLGYGNLVISEGGLDWSTWMQAAGGETNIEVNRRRR